MTSPIIWIVYNQGLFVYKGNEEGLYKKLHELLNSKEMLDGEETLNLDIAVYWADEEPIIE